jgi:hypothetical protein
MCPWEVRQSKGTFQVLFKNFVEGKTKKFLQLLQHQWPLGEEMLEVHPEIHPTSSIKSVKDPMQKETPPTTEKTLVAKGKYFALVG